MATNTSHYNLVKPAYSDTADIAVINGNMDTIDTELYNNDTAIAKCVPYEYTVPSDMNSVTSTAGYPYFGRWTGADTSHAPIANNQGAFLGYKSSANFETQIGMDNSGNAYIRGKVNGTWGDWSQIPLIKTVTATVSTSASTGNAQINASIPSGYIPIFAYSNAPNGQTSRICSVFYYASTWFVHVASPDGSVMGLTDATVSIVCVKA